MLDDSCNVFRSVLQVMHGTSDVDGIIDALESHDAACVLALAPDASPLARVLAALWADRDDLVRPEDIHAASVDDIVRRAIRHPLGKRILPAWMRLAPPLWGYEIRDQIIRAVRHHRCPAGVAAALIGPCHESADILWNPDDIAVAITMWGRANPDAPNAWMDAINDHVCVRRLIRELERSPQAYARALPWLPESNRHIDVILGYALRDALAALAQSSRNAQDLHRMTMCDLVARALSCDAHALIRLALAMTDDAEMTNLIIDRLKEKICIEPRSALDIVNAALWRDIPDRIASTLCSLHDKHIIYHSIAFACGATDDPPPYHPQTAIGLFGALNESVWHTITRDHQRAWLRKLPPHWGHLAIRALGPTPDALACAQGATPEALHALRMHVTDENRVRRLAFLLALRGAPSPLVFTLVRHDPRWIADQDDDVHACLAIACGRLVDDFPQEFLNASRAFVRSIAAPLATLARVPTEDIRTRCTAIRFALATATLNDVAQWVDLLPVNDPPEGISSITQACRIAASPHSDAVGAFDPRWIYLSHLEPSVAIPSLHALHELFLKPSSSQSHRFEAAKALAESLQGDGEVFWRIMESLPKTTRELILHCQSFQSDDGMRACVLHHPYAALLLFDAFQGIDAGTLHADDAAAAALDALQPFPHDVAWRVIRSLKPSVFNALVGYAEQHINVQQIADDHERFISAVDRIRTLHPSAAIAALRAIADVPSAWDESQQRRCSERFFGGLRAHGETAADIVRAMNNKSRERLLPSRMGDDDDSNERAEALMNIVVSSPDQARRLAWALHACAQFPHDPSRIAEAIMSMGDIPSQLVRPVFDALPPSLRQRFLPDSAAFLDLFGMATDDQDIRLRVEQLIHNAPVEAAVVYGVAQHAIAVHLDDQFLDRWVRNNFNVVRFLHPMIQSPAIALLMQAPGIRLIFADIDSLNSFDRRRAFRRRA